MIKKINIQIFFDAVKRNWLLGAILFMAFVLGLYRWKDCPMFVDEFYSITLAQRSLLQIWLSQADMHNYYLSIMPPLYETILHFFWNPSGNLFFPRLLSIIFHVTSLYLMFLLIKNLLSREVALITVFLVSLNNCYNIYAKMIRCYSFWNMLAMLSFYLFFRMIKLNRISLRYLLGLLLVNAMILYTFYFGAFVIILEIILAAIFVERKNLLKIWGWLLSAFLLFIPWVPRFLEHVAAEPILQTDRNYSIFEVVWERFSYGLFGNEVPLLLYGGLLLWATVHLFILLKKKGNSRKELLALWLILVIPALIINAITYKVVDPYRIRYLLPFVFPLFVFAAFIIHRSSKMRGNFIFGILSLVSLSSLYVYDAPSVDSQNFHDFWQATIARMSKQMAEFPLPKDDIALIYIEQPDFVPIFVYYFCGPQYFQQVSENLENLNKLSDSLKDSRYRIYYGQNLFNHDLLLDDIVESEKIDWIFLFYSDGQFMHKDNVDVEGKKFYKQYLKDIGLWDKIDLIQHKNKDMYHFDIYKVRKDRG
ncbi:MAG: glycosyltransferase family 39 protein [Candidatus Omnitrophota bacterium]